MECNKCQNWILIEDEIDEHGEEVSTCLNPCGPKDNFKKLEGDQDYFSRRVFEALRKDKNVCITCEKNLLKNEDFRDKHNLPHCEDCLIDIIHEDYNWSWEFIEDVLLPDLKDKFNRNYNLWQKDFFENNLACDGEHPEYSIYYVPKENLKEINGRKYCESCLDNDPELTIKIMEE